MSTEAITAYRPTSGVYALVDPRNGRVSYVGQSLDIDHRYRRHLDPNAYDSNVAKKRWINELHRLGMTPRLVLLAEAPYPESDRIETEEIRKRKATGECELNRAGGGRTNRGTLKLASSHPDSWLEVGRELKAIRDSVMALTRVVGSLGGPKLSSYVLEATRPLENAALRIDMKLAETYPGWDHFAKAFYGDSKAP